MISIQEVFSPTDDISVSKVSSNSYALEWLFSEKIMVFFHTVRQDLLVSNNISLMGHDNILK